MDITGYMYIICGDWIVMENALGGNLHPEKLFVLTERNFRYPNFWFLANKIFLAAATLDH